MIHVLYEGTPVCLPLPATAGYWEAGNVGMLAADANGKTVASLSDGTKVYGIFADRKGTTATIANILPLNVDKVAATGERNIGDESLFQQPGILNPLNLIPTGTMRTTNLLPDETSPSNRVTLYIRGGEYETDQYEDETFTVNAVLYSSATGKLTQTPVGVSSPQVGIVVTPPMDTYRELLHFKSTL